MQQSYATLQLMNAVTLADFRDAANRIWPEHTAQDWDRVGLVVGRDRWPVTRVLLAVDAVRGTVAEAHSRGADLLFTHHPLLLRGVTSVASDTHKGDVLTTLIESKCALYSAHTNADAPRGGVSDVLAQAFGLQRAQAIETSGDASFGIGRVGDLADPLTLKDFAQRVAQVIPATASGVRVSGDPGQLVQRIALCGGAGDSLLEHPLVREADAYVTSDLRHHPAQESRERSAAGGGPALIDISHWASESLWLHDAAHQLQQVLPSVEFCVSERNTDPWSFTVS